MGSFAYRDVFRRNANLSPRGVRGNCATSVKWMFLRARLDDRRLQRFESPRGGIEKQQQNQLAMEPLHVVGGDRSVP